MKRFLLTFIFSLTAVVLCGLGLLALLRHTALDEEEKAVVENSRPAMIEILDDKGENDYVQGSVEKDKDTTSEMYVSSKGNGKSAAAQPEEWTNDNASAAPEGGDDADAAAADAPEEKKTDEAASEDGEAAQADEKKDQDAEQSKTEEAGAEASKADAGSTAAEPAAEENVKKEVADPYAGVSEDRYSAHASTAQAGVVSMAFAGDILFDPAYAIQATINQNGGRVEDSVGASLLAEMNRVDIMVINNEFPYSDRGAPQADKKFTFRAPTKNVSQLKVMGADIVGLANNHSFDYGEEAFLDTLDTLDNAGIKRMGAGRDISEASHPFYYYAGGMKIALIAATQIERYATPNTRGATDTLPGVFRCMDETKLLEKVREAKAESDFVIVFIHWGTENVTDPDWLQQRQAPELAQAGADLVIGAHSHCLQPIGYEGNVPVFYSLGNFLFNSKTLDSCLVECEIERNASGAASLKSLHFLPCVQKGMKVRFAEGDEKARILQFMRDVSPGVTIGDDGLVSK